MTLSLVQGQNFDEILEQSQESALSSSKSAALLVLINWRIAPSGEQRRLINELKDGFCSGSIPKAAQDNISCGRWLQNLSVVEEDEHYLSAAELISCWKGSPRGRIVDYDDGT